MASISSIKMIQGATLLSKNFEMLKDKKLIVFTTGVTPLDCREYYDKMVIEKNFKGEQAEKIKVFNFLLQIRECIYGTFVV